MKLRPALRILLLGLLLLLPGSADLPLIDRDEPRFARATVEMARRGDWIIPWLNNEYRFDKPPLIYWLMAPFQRWLGANEFSSRLPSILFSILTALFLYRLMALGGDDTTAETGALWFLFSMQLVQHGRAAVADMPMVFAVTWTMAILFRLLHGWESDIRRSRRLRLQLLLALTLGFYAKGPVAWAVPALALMLHRWILNPQPLPWKRLGLIWLIPAVLGLVALWGIPALWKTRGEFWRVGMGLHVMERGVRSFNGRGVVPGYYLLTGLFSLYPASLFLPRMIRHLRFQPTPRMAFAASWFLAPLILFSFYATQLPHYILPGFGGFVWWWAESARIPQGERSIWDKVHAWLLRGVWVLFGLVLAVAAWKIPLPGLRLAAWGAVLVIAGLNVASARRWVPAGLCMAAGVHLIGTGMRDHLPARQLLALWRNLPPDTACAMADYYEPSVFFYSDRFWERIAVEDAESWMNQPGPRHLILLEAETKLGRMIRGLAGGEIRPSKDLRATLDRLALSSERVVEGINPARASWVRLRIYSRLE